MRFLCTLLNGSERRVSFKHFIDEKTGKQVTKCRMDIYQPKANKWEPFYTATASCSSTDTPNKWYGRKVALGRLVWNLKKEDRWFVWQAYHNEVAKDVLKKNSFEFDTEQFIPRAYISNCVKIAAMWQKAFNPKSQVR